MRWFRKLICKWFGHNDVVIELGHDEHTYPERGSSTWGYYHCSRCDRDEVFQFDE